MRVIDKRMFNADGELRDEVRKELEDLAKQPAPPPAAPEPTRPAAEARPGPATPPPAEKPGERVERAADEAGDDEEGADSELASSPTDPAFVRLVMTLSNQAGLFLGLLVDPLNPAGSVDLPTAKTFVDMLVSLAAKTRGRLNEEEAQLLESVLYELRMAYVERTRRPQRG